MTKEAVLVQVTMTLISTRHLRKWKFEKTYNLLDHLNRDSNKSKEINKKVGPGSYNSSYKPNYFSIRKLQNEPGPSFTAEERFRHTSQSESSPGPGSYKIKSALMQKIKRASKKGKADSFGTAQVRRSIFEPVPNLPGPGYYQGTMRDTIEQQTISKTQESRNAYGRVIPKSSSMFLSSVKKNLSYINRPY